MAVIRPYPIGGQVEARPAGGGLRGDVSRVANVGGVLKPVVAQTTFSGGRDLIAAGAQLERASDNVTQVALADMQSQNETRVQDLANQFISSQQAALYTGDDAFYRKKGRDALDAVQPVTDSMLERKKQFIELAQNEYQKRRLTSMLDGQVVEAMGGMNRHAVAQQSEYEKTVAQGRLNVLNNDAVVKAGDSDHLDGLAAAAEDTARNLAKMQGVTGTDAETSMVTSARSSIYRNAIESRVRNGDGRSALTLWDRVRDKLDAKDNEALASAMKSTATDVAADDVIAQRTPNPQRQTVRKFFEAKGYTPEAASALAGNFQEESQFNTNAVNPKDGRDGSDSIGIGQWNSSRAQDLLKFAATNKLDPKSLQTQLEFANWELNNTEKAAGDKLKSAKSLDEANSAAVSYFRPAKAGPQRLNYARAAFNDTGVGFDKANSDALVKTILDDPSLNPQVKAAAITKLQKQASVTESARNATIKGLDDTLEATSQLMIAAPNLYKKGTLGQLADSYESAGEKSKSINTRLLAGMEDQLLAFAQSPNEAQGRIIANLLPGKAKALAEGILAANTKDAAESTKAARDDFSAIKTAADNGVPLATQTEKIKGAFDKAVRGRDRNLIGEMSDWINGRAAAESQGQAPEPALGQLLTDLRDKVQKGQQTNADIIQLDQLDKIRAKQQSDFAKDPYAAGTALYPEVGQPVALDWSRPDNLGAGLAMRAQQARQISARRGGIAVAPFSDQEITALKAKLDDSPPDQQGKLMASLSALPADMIPTVAAKLAGKQDTGDPLSRSYAAALSMYADKDPAQRAVADQILRGAKIIKEMGESGKKPAQTSDAWQAALQDRVGNVFNDMGAKVPAVISDAIASVYTYQMHQAGRQGEKTDTDVLDKAVKTVLGDTLYVRGQRFLPPSRGMSRYEFDGLLGRLTDGDLNGAKTIEGDPITADVIRRKGVFSNVAEGQYKVRIPDPRRGGDLSEVQGPDGRAWILDGKALLQRTPPAPSRDPNAPDFVPTPSLGGRRDVP